MKTLTRVAADNTFSSPAGAAAPLSSPTPALKRKKKIIRPARQKSRIVARLEYCLFLGLFFFFRLLPFPMAFRIGEGIGWLLYLCDRPHRRVGLINLAIAFPHKSEAERRAILRASLVNLGRMIAEFCHMHTLTKDNIHTRVRFADHAQWQAMVSQYQETGVLALSGHFGNWELMAYAHGCYGLPVYMIHRRLRNPLVDNLINRERGRCGTQTIRKTTAGFTVRRALRQKTVVVAAVDQNASRRMRTFVPFFSLLAATSNGLAGLALTSGLPVIPAFLVRENSTPRHRIVLLPPVDPVRTGDRQADLHATTAKFTAVFQQMVEQYPDHWLWIHRRWKRRPEGEAPIY